MFNPTAFVSTLLIITLLALVYTGAFAYLRHQWNPVRYGGLLLSSLAFAALVAHVVAITFGA